MHAFATLSGAAVLLAAFAKSVVAVGSANVVNSCGTTVYYKIISTSEQAYKAIPAGGVHSPFSLPGVGISIKLALNTSISAPVSQFEYTWADGMVAYDLSNIDGDPTSPAGYPFAAGGMIINPSISNDPNFPTCVPVDCPAGTLVCTAAYNLPDDPKTMVCDEDAVLTLTLCPGISSKKRDVHDHNNLQRRRPRHPHATLMKV